MKKIYNTPAIEIEDLKIDNILLSTSEDIVDPSDMSTKTRKPVNFADEDFQF